MYQETFVTPTSIVCNVQFSIACFLGVSEALLERINSLSLPQPQGLREVISFLALDAHSAKLKAHVIFQLLTADSILARCRSALEKNSIMNI